MNAVWLIIELALTAGVITSIWMLVRSIKNNRDRLSFAPMGWTIALIVIGLVFLIFTGGTMLSSGDTSGEGYSTGVIVNHGSYGWPWPNRVVWLLHDGEIHSEPFGIVQNDPSLWQRVNEAQGAEQRVRVHFQSSFFCWAWDQSDCAVIDKIEIVR